MILADKIIEERKKLGLSQEELAEKLCVSRQAVSKWEGAQSIPDLQKIIAMSELFSVSTDYLLKDDIEPERVLQTENDTDRIIRKVSLEEANEYLVAMIGQSKRVALGVSLCVLSPVLIIFLEGFVKGGYIANENIAIAFGMIALFLLIALAVFLFIRSGIKTDKYDYLEKEQFETAYGVTSIVKEKEEAYEPTYSRMLTIGITICVLAVLPLIIVAIINEEAETLIISMTALMLCLIALGVYLIVRTAIVKSSFSALLQEGEYKKKAKEKDNVNKAVSSIYWCTATAIYLTWSFISKDWDITTLAVWPAAGLMFVPVKKIVELIRTNKK